MTEYREIEGFPGYRVGDDGSVWSAWHRTTVGAVGCRGIGTEWKPLKARQTYKGYVKVALFRYVGGERQRLDVFIHKLVLTAFIGPRPAGQETRHKNNDRADNALRNLAWGTPLENAADRRSSTGYGMNRRGEDHGMAKLDESKVRKILLSGLSTRALAGMLGISKTTVTQVRARKTWRHVNV
jgi:hypothetical protein